jgi:predicted amidohydrolase
MAVSDDVDRNVPTVMRAIAYAAGVGADILLTPEGSVSGYHSNFEPSRVRDAVRAVVDAAAAAHLALALGTCYEEDDGRRYDELRFYDGSGRLIGFHAKILLCKDVRAPHLPAELDRFATKPLTAFAFDGVVAGGLVCNDLWANPAATVMHDPHLTQELASLGAGLIFHAVNAGQARGDDLRLHRAFHESNLRLRARAAGVWIATADAADPGGLAGSRSPTGILDPAGRWVVKAAPRGEAFVSAQVEVASEPSAEAAITER